jgi:DEAD/DEAH box helicase domain-containing protein
MSQQDATEILSWLKDRGHYSGQIVHDQVVDGQDARIEDLSLQPSVEIALSQFGIDELYQHQVKSIEATRSGDNTVVATPTASGKSLTYAIPALERAIDHSEKTLYIAPMRALINDQAGTFRGMGNALGFNETVDIGVKTGKTTKTETRNIKQRQPDILLATIDQLHLSFLPYAHMPSHWRWLFQQLETVVIDEVHTYRGYFGSHASLIFRRLNRLLDHYGNDPQYICCSATIGNPVGHAASVTGRPVDSYTLVDDNASASGDKQWVFWNPPLKDDDNDSVPDPAIDDEGNVRAGHDAEPPETITADGNSTLSGEDGGTTPPVQENSGRAETTTTAQEDDTVGGERLSQHVESVRLFADLVTRGYQTLVFTSARQGAEQYVDWADSELRSRGEHDLADTVHAYHAALNSGRRRELEAGLKSGDIRGLWSTRALELGIDIGTLDAVILDGYPGTAMSTFQRAGRAGRGDDSCLVIMVGSDNPLDQHLLKEPERLFEDGAEQATVNPANQSVLPEHVICAADDHYLSPNDEQYFGESLPDVVDQLTDKGRLRRTNEDKIRWETSESDIQYNTDIRNIDEEEVQLIDRNRDETIGSLERDAALRDAHPNAIYTYDKQSYRVVELDLEQNRAQLESVDTSEYTRSLRDKEVTVEDTLATATLEFGDTEISPTLATLTVRNQITGYLRYANLNDDSPSEHEFDTPLPPSEITTTGLFFEIPQTAEKAILGRVDSPEEYLSGLHAVEHALISLYPSEVLCDRGDIGGLSTVSHPQTVGGTVFVHDGYPGGAGYCRAAFEQLNSLLEQTANLLDSCGCSNGCPSCIHSPHCGNGNRSLSKSVASDLLALLAG